MCVQYLGLKDVNIAKSYLLESVANLSLVCRSCDDRPNTESETVLLHRTK